RSYQDNDGNGSCEPDCAHSNLDCGARGRCDDGSGAAVCACDQGYAGLRCQSCAEGYQDNDLNGVCLPGCARVSLGCSGHGVCNDSSGDVLCACDPGYAGSLCNRCSDGFQDNDGDGVCMMTCASAEIDCGLGVCDESSGSAICLCPPEYTGELCAACADGYQDHDQNGICSASCEMLALTCSGHGVCADSSGTALCVCDDLFVGPSCASCASGYQDNDDNGTCTPNCATFSSSCSATQSCVDSSGTAQCVCITGHTGPNCASCAAGYQDNDGDGFCLPTCATAGYTCSGHGVCEDGSGEASCVCESGYINGGPGTCITNGTGLSCASPKFLDLSQTVVNDSTAGHNNVASGSCQSSSSADMVYVFSLTQTVTVSFESSGFDTVLHLRRDCAQPSSEVACDDDGGSSMGSFLQATLTAGTYYLFVDGYSGSLGAFILNIDVGCGPGLVFDPTSSSCVVDPCSSNPCTGAHMSVCSPIPPTGYSCSCDPGYIPNPSSPSTSCIVDPDPSGEHCGEVRGLTIVSSGLLNDSTAGASNDASATCGGNGPDLVYGFTLSEDMRAHFRVDGYDSVIHLRTTCNQSNTEFECNDDYAGWGAGSEIVTNLPAGTYYLWIDSYSQGGGYSLTYGFAANPCNTDPCPGTPVCQPSSDWSSYACVCPAGMLPDGGDCVDDPCDPNLCTTPYMTRCVPDLPGNYSCECNYGYIPDGSGGCILDPNANEWAFIVFLNADNNLESYGFEDVDEMAVAGSSPYVHIVALFDTYTGPAEIIFVEQGGYDVVENWGEADLSDWQVMRDFGLWAIQNYPARHYALIAWDHGGGWKAEDKPALFKGFSNDDHGAAGEISISNGDYARALQAITTELGGKIDIVGFDACLMGMWEVAEATAPYANYLLASSETEPGAGWPYHGFMPQLIADPYMSAEELGIAVVDAYYAESPDNSTLALTRLDDIDDLTQAVSDFADAMSAAPGSFSAFKQARQQTLSFADYDFIDLGDFAQRVSQLSSAPQSVKDAANALRTQLQSSVVYKKGNAGYTNYSGLSVYFPSSGKDSDYRGPGAVWSQRSTWDEFLWTIN
ncbi:MAG: clostripain-related cysteine peptidase, partial [Myxococcota bacterium]|nr:clostripain-related cysteine peptidase [Myxococcota bacterium]